MTEEESESRLAFHRHRLASLAFVIPMITFIAIAFTIPIEHNFFMNDSLEDPAWFRYSWWLCGAIVFLWIMSGPNKSSNPIGTIMCVFFGPLTLAAMGCIWIFKKAGWYK